MKISLGMRLQTEAQQRLELCGGATDSLFPQVEALLLSDPDAQEALFFVTQSKSLEKYESLMDFLFCETFREHRGKCQRYYDGKGSPLRETLSAIPEWRFYNQVMLGALEFAKSAHRANKRVDWCWFVGTLKKAINRNEN